MRMIVLGRIDHVCTISWLTHTHIHRVAVSIHFITVMRKLRELHIFIIVTSLLVLGSV